VGEGYVWKILYLLLTCVVAVGASQADAVPSDIQKCLDRCSVAENNSFTGPRECVPIVLSYLRENWRDVIDQIESVAPGLERQRVIYRAADHLPDDEFIEFLDAVTSKAAKREISYDSFKASYEFSAYKHDFLVRKAEEPKVRAYLAKWSAVHRANGVEPRVRTDAEMAELRRDLEDAHGQPRAADRNDTNAPAGASSQGTVPSATPPPRNVPEATAVEAATPEARRSRAWVLIGGAAVILAGCSIILVRRYYKR
jgi:hypothetical protein